MKKEKIKQYFGSIKMSFIIGKGRAAKQIDFTTSSVQKKSHGTKILVTQEQITLKSTSYKKF